MKTLIVCFNILLLAYCSSAPSKPSVDLDIKSDVVGEDVDYKIDKKDFQGYLAYDKSITGKRPGVLVIHEWWGLNDYPKKRAKQLADMGYVAFAMDMYGKGIVTDDHKKAGELSGAYGKDRKLMMKRINKALEILKSNPNVDSSKIAAIGYCFGGMSVLELALSGEELKGGVVSFHGMLASPNLKSGSKKVKTKVMIHHGADDGFMKKESVDEFVKTLKDAKVDLSFTSYPGAAHGFTRPGAGDHGIPGLAYNQSADYASFNAMKKFLSENFK
ncbi:MAG: dienelactone hydrolase family protein [Leptospiraceae bacterium]|nr:dienelactone hydrolase family protein [Leptospiraceae bacterium]